MKVILLENIKAIGAKFEVKDVSDGYARNFLFPNGLAKPAGAKELKAQGFEVNKKQIKLSEPIKEVGEHDAVVDYEHGLEAKIKVIVHGD